MRFVLALAVLALCSASADAGIIDNIRERREQRRQQKAQPTAAACTFCNPCRCPPGACPSRCPVAVQPTAFSSPAPSAQQLCPNGKCPLKR